MSRHADGMRLALIAGRPTPTNEALCRARIAGTGWELLTPQEALDALRPGDGVLGRLDVLPTLDGVEDGLWALGALAAREVRVLNDRAALLSAHDKLLTARLLRRYAIAHPVTSHVRAGRVPPLFTGPVVVKPRFGSGGSGVCLCDDAESLADALARAAEQGWYRRHGALVQELVPPQGFDLRVLVAAGRVVGAVHRIAAQGEWRTNVALGAVRRPRPRCATRCRCPRDLRCTSDRRIPRRRRPASDSRRWVDRRRAERSGRVHLGVLRLVRCIRRDG